MAKINRQIEQKSKHYRPQMEMLEDRTVLSSITASYPSSSGTTEQFAWDLANATQGGSVKDFSVGLPTSPIRSGPSGNIFLTLTGIQGTSTATGHTGAFEIDSFAWAGDHSAGGSSVLTELHLTDALSEASPLLMANLAPGTIIPQADMVVQFGSGTLQGQEFYEVQLSNVRIGSYHVVSASNQPEEEFPLDFASALVNYTPYSGGVAQPKTTFTWTVPASAQQSEQTVGPTVLLGAPAQETAFLKLDGITGDSQNADFPGNQGWFEVSTLDWSVDESLSAPPRFTELRLTKQLGTTEVSLLNELAQPLTRAQATLELATPNPSGKTLPFYQINLSNVQIGSYREISSDPRPNKESRLRSSSATVTCLQQSNTAPPATTTFQWDVSTRGGTVQKFQPSFQGGGGTSLSVLLQFPRSEERRVGKE